MTEENAPIFIVGCGHSGTSLLLNILGSHSHIFAIPFETYLAYKWPSWGEEAELFLSNWNTITIYSGKRRWAEKTPRHVFRLKEIMNHFPTSKILLMIRDGRDVACSLQDRFGNLTSGINRWVKDNLEGEQFWNHSNVCCVRYETLIEQPEVTLRLIVDFLKEPFEESMLEFHKSPKYYYHAVIERPPNGFGANHPVLRNWQINQPLFDGRGKWLRMTEEEKQLVKEKAGKMLIDYGYTSDLNW